VLTQTPADSLDAADDCHIEAGRAAWNVPDERPGKS